MKKLMKRLKTYDIENIVRNTLLILMFVNFICIILLLAPVYGEDCVALSLAGLDNFSSDMTWPLGITTYVVTIIYFVAAFKSKNDKFFKIMFAFTSLFINIMSFMLLILGILKLYGCQ